MSTNETPLVLAEKQVLELKKEVSFKNFFQFRFLWFEIMQLTFKNLQD
jgi:hypothetical protein